MDEFNDLICKSFFKFQLNRIKIEDLENLAQISLLAYVYLKMYRWLNSVTWDENALQISSQSNENGGFSKIWPKLAYWPMSTFWPMFISELVGGWIQWPDVQMFFKFKVNRIKIEKFGQCWPFGLCRPFGLSLPQN